MIQLHLMSCKNNKSFSHTCTHPDRDEEAQRQRWGKGATEGAVQVQITASRELLQVGGDLCGA